ncbi:prolyl oligopeptidase family serine peptidase [Aliikangiella sp. G2MR2-5]|uniref:S9 family peptidase n=1 Tax=Aliikangiella sp. G2MR2-5 TaxID=2788943 RepID=UPI0018AB2AD7|nr:prolyl oligopeptidase family serine peptidase [Aliikangiella sp. G2MR2-5]
MSRLWQFLATAILVVASFNAWSDTALGYQKPPSEILDLVDIKLAPSTFMDDKRENMLMLYRDTYKSISDLSKKEMRLAGLRIDPVTNIGSRVTYYNEMKIKHLVDGKTITVKGIPENARLANFQWSPDQKKMAFTHTTETAVELWYLDIAKAKAKRLSKMALNANLGNVITWFADSRSLLVKAVPENKRALIDTNSAVPNGPTISVSDGKKAQNRTYQDLLKNKDDEFNFEQLALSTLYKVTLKGKSKRWLDTAMYGDLSISPDGKYVLVNEVKRPFSYLVPYYRFASSTSVYDIDADLVSVIADTPLVEDLPKGFMAVIDGRREVSWRQDEAATLIYVKALDGGDPAKEVEFRDQVYQLSAPFKGEGRPLIKTFNRFYRITWGDNNTAIAQDYWWNNRNTKSYLFAPNDNSKQPRILFDRNYQDRYSDPGSFVTQRNQFARPVLAIQDGSLFLLGAGHSKEGQFPFLDSLSLNDQKLTRLYHSSYTDKLERLYDFEADKSRLLVRIESKNEYPNYYFRTLNSQKQALTQITHFENPFKSIQNVEKQVIDYKREDGLELSATLYLPLDYKKGEKYPMLMWAYPREFKDKSSASQNTQNPNEFTYPYYGSPIYWVTKGYVVLDDAAFPIVGEGEEEPNDSFRTQLVANAKAAIDAVDEKGLIDRERVAVGGHSYGAFMVANLLSHSDLFAAGIARSGAYNRTLTPFGFQSEERSYWEAPDIYYTMSPFMHADKMKTPLLLIHGNDDNNSGTYPMQSERYFNALKGLGAPVRLVMLPKESHGYRAKESILHVLWEQDRWLDLHLKPKQSQLSNAK